MNNHTIIFCDNSLRELINFREDVINSYAEKGYRVILIAPENTKYEAKYPSITHISISLSRSGKNPFNDFIYFLRLLYFYKKIKPVFIFHYTVKPNIYGSLAAAILRIPSAAMIAGLGFLFSNEGLIGKIGRNMYKFAMKFPKKIFVLNQMNRDLLINHSLADESQIILLKGGEGINLKKFC